jgi:hypothetical protein
LFSKALEAGVRLIVLLIAENLQESIGRMSNVAENCLSSRALDAARILCRKTRDKYPANLDAHPLCRKKSASVGTKSPTKLEPVCIVLELLNQTEIATLFIVRNAQSLNRAEWQTAKIAALPFHLESEAFALNVTKIPNMHGTGPLNTTLVLPSTGGLWRKANATYAALS